MKRVRYFFMLENLENLETINTQTSTEGWIVPRHINRTMYLNPFIIMVFMSLSTRISKHDLKKSMKI